MQCTISNKYILFSKLIFCKFLKCNQIGIILPQYGRVHYKKEDCDLHKMQTKITTVTFFLCCFKIQKSQTTCESIFRNLALKKMGNFIKFYIIFTRHLLTALYYRFDIINTSFITKFCLQKCKMNSVYPQSRHITPYTC